MERKSPFGKTDFRGGRDRIRTCFLCLCLALRVLSRRSDHFKVAPAALPPGAYSVVTGAKEIKNPGAIDSISQPVDSGETHAQQCACHQDHHAGTSAVSWARERSLSSFFWQ